jgi:hypothetical protein
LNHIQTPEHQKEAKKRPKKKKCNEIEKMTDYVRKWVLNANHILFIGFVAKIFGFKVQFFSKSSPEWSRKGGGISQFVLGTMGPLYPTFPPDSVQERARGVG